ncbi:MAG TPA: hypothetical protein VFC65_11925 [Prolixibacteraceae bacterium]|nr:hypothetical protein [Prolixibacteraceae bacterium]
MKIFVLQETLIITEKKINDIKRIKSQIESQLITYNARTFISENAITFSTFKSSAQSGALMDRTELLKIMKEGSISLTQESQTLKISWSVKLDSLYFIVILISIVAGISTSLYLNTALVISVSFGIILFLILLFTGIQYIKYQMNEIISISIYRQNR